MKDVARVSFWRLIGFRAYDLQLFDAMNDLKEQVKVEHVPIEVGENGKKVRLDWLTCAELRGLGLPRGVFLALRGSLHQVHRNIQKT